jgi:hypothetical protein
MPQPLPPHPIVLALHPAVARTWSALAPRTFVPSSDDRLLEAAANAFVNNTGSVVDKLTDAATAIADAIQNNATAAASRTTQQGGAAAGSDRYRAFSGYLGDQLTAPRSGAPGIQGLWQELFLDINLHRWILVKVNDIQHSERMKDRNAACGLRDYIWVKVDGLVGMGSATSSPEAIWLSGDLTRAGDFASSFRSDTRSQMGGLLDDATTPLCCSATSYHYP